MNPPAGEGPAGNVLPVKQKSPKAICLPTVFLAFHGHDLLLDPRPEESQLAKCVH